MSTIAVPKLPPLTRALGALGAKARWIAVAGLALLCIIAGAAGLVRAKSQIAYVTAPAPGVKRNGCGLPETVFLG